MLDGVEVHGILHQQRLHDAFYRRMGIMFQAVAVLATAAMRHDNQDSVLKQIRKLAEFAFPEDKEKLLEQEEAMKDVLRREGQKSYKVRRINLGERGE